MRAGRRAEAGSATIWVLAASVLLLFVGSLAAFRAAAVLARHRAEAAADVAALAAAGRLGTGAPPCLAAADLARRNSAKLLSCRVHADPAGRAGVVDVAVAVTVRLPGVGVTHVRASARAGRGTAGAAYGGAGSGSHSSTGEQFRATGLSANAVWHAGPRRPDRGRAALEHRGRRRAGG